MLALWKNNSSLFQEDIVCKNNTGGASTEPGLTHKPHGWLLVALFNRQFQLHNRFTTITDSLFFQAMRIVLLADVSLLHEHLLSSNQVLSKHNPESPFIFICPHSQTFFYSQKHKKWSKRFFPCSFLLCTLQFLISPVFTHTHTSFPLTHPPRTGGQYMFCWPSTPNATIVLSIFKKHSESDQCTVSRPSAQTHSERLHGVVLYI